MAYTTEQLSALTDAISLGATRVVYGDKTVEYRSLSDMLKLQNVMMSELTPKISNRRKLVSYGRGYENANELG